MLSTRSGCCSRIDSSPDYCRSNAEAALGTALSSKSATTWESAGRSISRVPGMAIYISESSTGLPAGFVSMLRSVGVVHTAVIFLTVQRVRRSGLSLAASIARPHFTCLA